ncbi:unnamed protein product [Schistocephalus solidus]|uniref:Protein FAM102A n=1 Tax=Schistocephalus solidus TaxID=70667 RepID=A0A183TDH8_SCHSO|nr:unnamed protein product [Schistocephalus solidus]
MPHDAGFLESSCLSDAWSISDDGFHFDFSSEFRPPPPPSTNGTSGNSNMRTTRAGGLQAAAAAAAAAAGVRSSSPSVNFVGNGVAGGDASSTASSTPPSTPRRYNRRVQLRPIKMTDSDEVNALLRQIMETNSQAINFDPREMHMAVQRELRLRNRTVNTGGTISSGSTSLSGCCSSSLGYSSEFSSVENCSVEGNPLLTLSPSTASAAVPTTTRSRRS